MRFGGRESIRWWANPVLLAGVALAFDAADRRVPFNILGSGLLDEPAHLATAALGLLVLACLVEVPRRFYVAALIASVAIDLDHIPLYLGLLGNGGQRPVTHSLSTVIVVAVAAVISRRHRAVLAGVATGLVLHFARGHRRRAPGRQDALATSGHSLDGQLLVVPRHDHRIHGCPADPRKHRGPPHARPSPGW